MTFPIRDAPRHEMVLDALLVRGKDESVVRYSVLHGNEQLFASTYRLVLPTEDELRRELERERAALGERQLLDETDRGGDNQP